MVENCFFTPKITYLSICSLLQGLHCIFLTHIAVSGRVEWCFHFIRSFYPCLVTLLSVAWRNLAGCTYCSLSLTKKYGFVLSAVFVGIIWTLWHIPLFFIPGTNHGEGLINFWMFAVQLMAFRFFNGAIYKISGKGCVFMCILFHTMFNAASPIFGTTTMTWAGTIAANSILVLVSIVTVVIYEKKSRRIV